MSSEPTLHEIDRSVLRELDGTFASPRWLRDLGRTSWLLVGCGVVLVGIVWFLGTAAVIVTPLVAATIIATVAMPAVALLERRRVPRVAGAAIVLLALVALGTPTSSTPGIRKRSATSWRAASTSTSTSCADRPLSSFGRCTR